MRALKRYLSSIVSHKRAAGGYTGVVISRRQLPGSHASSGLSLNELEWGRDAVLEQGGT